MSAHHEKHFKLGTIKKTHGVDGSISIYLDTDNPMHYATIKHFFIEINKSLIPFFIEKININKNFAAVKLEDVNSIPQAMEFMNLPVFLPDEMLAKTQNRDFYHEDAIGFKAIDVAYGDIGIITDVTEIPGQQIFIVTNDTNEIMIPAIQNFIEKIDIVSKTIIFKTPEGLIDVYTSPSSNEEE